MKSTNPVINFMKKLEAVMELGGTKRDIVFLAISGVALLCSILDIVKLPFDPAWVAIILCGLPIVLEAVIGLVTEFDIKADVLVSMALIASVCIGEDFAAGEVAFIMQIGGLLEELTVAKARQGIEKLVHLTPQTARVISADGKETVIPAEKVGVGDILSVLPGETVPVDGVIISGETSIDQAVMTGESLPVDKTVGDEVSSGTVNQFGAFEMKASKVGEDSSIQRMIKLVQSADAGKAKIVGIADRWATWIVVIALTAAQAIASQLHIGKDSVRAECLPEDKLNAIKQLQSGGQSVCMIGDGINDAPALKTANVGIAMGGIGSDIAVEAADIALVDDRIQELPHLLSLSRKMMTIIKLNLTFSMTLNFVAIILAITGVLNPVVGALVQNAGSVLVIINSALLLKWRKK